MRREFEKWVEIDLDKTAYNVREIKSPLKPGTMFMAVVKADAYGHGLSEVSRVALRNGAGGSMKILDDADVCIIGGGLVGSNIAYRLSKEKKKVILLEKKFLTAGASGSTFGLIGFQWFKYDTGMPPLFLDYLRETYEMYKGLTQEIGSDFEYKIEGSIVVIETEAELKQREELVRLFEKNDLDIFLLNKEETLRKEPFVNPHILGSTFCPYWVMLTPVVGQITTNLITKNRSKLPIDDYRLSRYEKEVSP